LARLGLVIALCVAALAANTRTLGSSDTKPAAMLPFVLLRQGSLTFEGVDFHNPDFAQQQRPLPYYLQLAPGGRVASKYPLATGILALPFYALAAAGSFEPRDTSVSDLEKLAAAVLSALGAGLLYLSIRRLIDERIAVLSTALYAAGTPFLPILGQALWQHTGAALGFSISLFGFSTKEVRLRGLLVGIGAGLAVACRPPDVVLAAAFLVALALESIPAVGWASIPFAAPIGLTLLYQHHLFGGYLATGYGGEASAGWTANWLEGFAGLLASPGRGWFVQSPILAVALLPFARASWRSQLPGWLAIVGAGVAAFVCMMAKWGAWDGGYSFGNRMLADTLPIWAIALAYGLRLGRGARSFKLALIPLATISILTMGTLTYVFPSPAAKARVLNLSEGAWSIGSHPLIGFVRH